VFHVILWHHQNIQLDPLSTQYYCLQEHPELKLSSYGRKMTKFGRPAPKIEGLLATTLATQNLNI